MIYPFQQDLENLYYTLKSDNNLSGLRGLKQTASDLSNKYIHDKNKDLRTIEQSLTYALCRMPATYSACYKSFQVVTPKINTEIKTIFDFGAGTGATSIAIHQFLEQAQITSFETQKTQSDIGKKLAPFCDWSSKNILTDTFNQTADLVVSAYVLNELSNPVESALKLWNISKSTLILIDNAMPKTSEMMQKIRQELINNGAYMIAPCPRTNLCTEWCHFAVRVERSKLHKALKNASAPFEDEKFTFLAFSKTPVELPQNRVLRHPQISSGKITLSLCTNSGTENRIITKSNKENYKSAKKSSWGDEF